MERICLLIVLLKDKVAGHIFYRNIQTPVFGLQSGLFFTHDFCFFFLDF